MAYIEIDDTNFNENLENEFSKNQIVILKFSSEFCDACIALDFELEEIDAKYDNVTIFEIDCVESESLTDRFGVTQVPTMVIYENAHSTLWHKEGVLLAQDIEKIIGDPLS